MHETLDANQLYVTVDLLILTVEDGKLNILLSRRTQPPYAQRWALPGRFVPVEESSEKAARNLLKKMLPVEGAYLEQLYTFTEVNRDPRGRVISLAYLVIIPFSQLENLLASGQTTFQPFRIQTGEGLKLTTQDGAELTDTDLAFDHGRIIETGIRRLQGKIDYTEIGFRFLNDPENFSLGELQAIYEAVLEKPEDGSNFRRFIRKRYEETGRIVQLEREERKARGRPAVLYRFIGG